jgi:hypothetical protein
MQTLAEIAAIAHPSFRSADGTVDPGEYTRGSTYRAGTEDPNGRVGPSS